ncbi:MAG: SagB family peptide dehydrogenase [Armatimonadota bacterium]|nr:SagB family peptide dehydrogenase [Armatimonadota bacterium]
METGGVDNRRLEATWTYHNHTKHSPASVRTGGYGLDWANQPLPYKIYSTLEPLALPQDLSFPRTAALDAIAAGEAATPGTARMPDLRTLAGLLYLSGGITKRIRLSWGSMDFRAAACTGALYHIEIYLVCADLPDLPAGVYHFGVHDFALRRLRTGDFRAAVAEATGSEPSVASAPVVVVLTTTFWRNAWKYRARAYRHAFWDSGTILANFLAASAAYRLPARVVCGFADAEANRLLDLDTQREVAVAMVALGRDGPAPSAAPEITPLGLATVPLSGTEVDFPAIRAMHAASSLQSAGEVQAWRAGGPPRSSRGPAASLVPLQPLPDFVLPPDPLSRVIVRRGSSRRFLREPIPFAHLSTMLDRATRGIPADFLEPPGTILNDLHLIAHAVDGLPSGAYAFRREASALEPIREGDFRRHAGYLALEQPLAADASANVYFLADLAPILERFGNRGYRVAQLEAAIMGGRLYLAAYALGLGATGLTFYDDDVTEFFSPHAAGKSVMFLTALGVPARRGRRT